VHLLMPVQEAKVVGEVQYLKALVEEVEVLLTMVVREAGQAGHCQMEAEEQLDLCLAATVEEAVRHLSLAAMEGEQR